MQYKDATKIILDKRKLDILIRLGCPDEQLLEIIKTGTFTQTGDELIDDTLECLIDVRDFNNWGGKREGAGRPRKNQLENQDEIQDDNQVGNQVAIQVVDKDRDIDSVCKYNNNNNFKKPSIEEISKYITGSKLKIDARKFFSYYDSRGWCDKDGKHIDWKEKLLQWYIRDINDDNPYKVEWH